MTFHRPPYRELPEDAMWMAEECDGHAHCIPLEDTYPHKLGADCWCQPVEDEDNPFLLLHNAHDGRVDYEEGWREPH
jgi:hypothetical protein